MGAKRNKTQFGLAHRAYLQGRITMREFRAVIRSDAKMSGGDHFTWRPFHVFRDLRELPPKRKLHASE